MQRTKIKKRKVAAEEGQFAFHIVKRDVFIVISGLYFWNHKTVL